MGINIERDLGVAPSRRMQVIAVQFQFVKLRMLVLSLPMTLVGVDLNEIVA